MRRWSPSSLTDSVRGVSLKHLLEARIVAQTVEGRVDAQERNRRLAASGQSQQLVEEPERGVVLANPGVDLGRSAHETGRPHDVH